MNFHEFVNNFPTCAMIWQAVCTYGSETASCFEYKVNEERCKKYEKAFKRRNVIGILTMLIQNKYEEEELPVLDNFCNDMSMSWAVFKKEEN